MAVRVEPLQAPKLDLYTSKLSSAGQIHLFGSVHDATRDGAVVLLALTLSCSPLSLPREEESC
jgi:hypothetical protein